LCKKHKALSLIPELQTARKKERERGRKEGRKKRMSGEDAGEKRKLIQGRWEC
jgi:hypothetical protein